MKTYYVYLNRYLVCNIEANSIADAIAKIPPNFKYDAVTTVYQPEPRTVGERLDDGIEAARKSVPALRSKVSNIFGNLSRLTAPVGTSPVTK